MKLNEHWKGKAWYGYKRMIGGYRFYFPTADRRDKPQRLKAEQASLAVEAIWHPLKIAGATAWPSDKLEEAKATVKAVLYGHQAIVKASEASDLDPIPFDGGNDPTALPDATGLHALISKYKLEQKARLDTKKIGPEAYRSNITRIERVKSDLADVPLAAYNRAIIKNLVDGYLKRPDSQRGTPMAVLTVKHLVAALSQFTEWLYKYEGWAGYKNWQDDFRFDPATLRTEDEKEATIKGHSTFTLAQLKTLWAWSGAKAQLYTLLGLNCAFTQKEIATLRKSHLHLDGARPYIERLRNKTEIAGRWYLWPETVEALRKNLAPDNSYGLALLSEDGGPLITYSAEGRHQNSPIKMIWQRLLKKLGPKEAGITLSFKYLRKTSGDAIQKKFGLQVAQWFMAQEQGSVAQKHYVNADFDKVGEATDWYREQIQSIWKNETEVVAAA